MAAGWRHASAAGTTSLSTPCRAMNSLMSLTSRTVSVVWRGVVAPRHWLAGSRMEARDAGTTSLSTPCREMSWPTSLTSRQHGGERERRTERERGDKERGREVSTLPPRERWTGHVFDWPAAGWRGGQRQSGVEGRGSSRGLDTVGAYWQTELAHVVDYVAAFSCIC
jgi:hypothetical protein